MRDVVRNSQPHLAPSIERLLERPQRRKNESVSEIESFEVLHPVSYGYFVQQRQLLKAQQSEIGVVVVVQGGLVAAEHHMPHRS